MGYTSYDHIVSSLSPLIYGPFQPWQASNGLVHETGVVLVHGYWDRITFCGLMYAVLPLNYYNEDAALRWFHAETRPELRIDAIDKPVTCLECLVSDRKRGT